MNNEDSVLNCKLDNNLSITVPGKQVLLFFSLMVDIFLLVLLFAESSEYTSLLLNRLLSLLIIESAELLIFEFIFF